MPWSSQVLGWALENDDLAEQLGQTARYFARTVLSREMIEGYLTTMLREVAKLQHHDPPTDHMGHTLTLETIAERFDRESEKEVEHKGSARNLGGPVEAASARLQGLPCPQERCPQCCFRSPKTVKATGEDVEPEDSQGSWWRRHKNSKFAAWKQDPSKNPNITKGEKEDAASSEPAEPEPPAPAVVSDTGSKKGGYWSKMKLWPGKGKAKAEVESEELPKGEDSAGPPTGAGPKKTAKKAWQRAIHAGG